jgi:chemotaxis protein CheC
MSEASIALEELERDALTELVNIGVSRAASSLRTMVGRQVFLSVPAVEVVSRPAAAALIRERETGPLVAVRQEFRGAFNGQALLIFPEQNSLALVRSVAGEAMGTEDLLGIEDEALSETGNIVLNSCLATMANMLERPLEMSLPEVIRGEGGGLFEMGAVESGGVVLFLYINFSISDRDIRGYIAMLMDLPSLEALKALIRGFIARVLGDEAAS